MKRRSFDYLTRPCREGLPLTRRRYAMPELWERAKDLFARMLEVAGGRQRLGQPRRFTRARRREILGWLEPVEKLTRVLLLTKAVTFLLMTQEGARLMKETPKQAPWKEPPPPPPGPGTTRSVRIPYPGWHTIACHNRPPPPPLQPQPAPKPAQARPCAFRVLTITPPEPPVDALAALRRSLMLDLYDDPPPPARSPPPRRADAGPNAARPSRLARRIEALSRALERPGPIIRRLARFLAGLPAGLFQPSIDAGCRTGLWLCGQSEFVDAGVHLDRVMAAFSRLEPG